MGTWCSLQAQPQCPEKHEKWTCENRVKFECICVYRECVWCFYGCVCVALHPPMGYVPRAVIGGPPRASLAFSRPQTRPKSDLQGCFGGGVSEVDVQRVFER